MLYFNIFSAYIIIIFGVTVVNEDRQAEKTKVGVQIVARRWQGKVAAQPSFLSDVSAGTNSNNNNDNYMRTPRHFFLSRFLDTGLAPSILIFTLSFYINFYLN